MTKAFEKKIDRALLASLKHWDANLENCPSPLDDDIEGWFNKNCFDNRCPLCILFNRLDLSRICDSCPLDDKLGKEWSIQCCKEWQQLRKRAAEDKPIKHNVRAVRDRIRRECDKRGIEW